MQSAVCERRETESYYEYTYNTGLVFDEKTLEVLSDAELKTPTCNL